MSSTARDPMSAGVATVTPSASVDAVLDLLVGDDPDINRVPVVDDDGQIVGSSPGRT